MVGSLEQILESAQANAAHGRRQEARKAYEDACCMAMVGDGEATPMLQAIAALGFASLVLQEVGAWPELLGKGLDDVLLDALEANRDVVPRNRTLEGQLLLLRSRALFAKPKKDATCIDAALEARREASDLILEGAVEALPWSVVQIESLLRDIVDAGTVMLPLSEETLIARLGDLGGGPEAAEHVSTLFDEWAQPGQVAGEAEMTLRDFFERFLKVAKRFERAVDKAPCAAPCDGGLPEGSSQLEKELVALVSRDGAGKWSAKAVELQGKGFSDATAESVKASWRGMAPKLRKTIDTDAPMACGHSCSTCPTKDECQLHDALKDIEDM
ncbi:unnamed protein product [Polarella glacialis]|uniref:Uncharacterized protein n=1 Tax=Polarella glacialis TaxID=89957 RepID=A0A813LYG5_POLGL|nr:unnamed protein product [Polarella glacialis]|mmetsp:Transcript_41034/g.74331  ORF Transcript_41034/g.74331 Transcript_41034/m.74331 type:complete len:329 (+) Transcript_41034:155-1141(+)